MKSSQKRWKINTIFHFGSGNLSIDPSFAAIERERVVISLIVAMVVLVAGFNILTTIFVSVSQKQKDISILKALGARNKQITRLFVTQGVLIGIVGSILGCIFALDCLYHTSRNTIYKTSRPLLFR